MKFYGFSFITNETGEVVKQANEEETVLVHSFNLDEIKNNRGSWGLLRDRRPNLYTPLISNHANPSVGGSSLEFPSQNLNHLTRLNVNELTTPRNDGFHMPA